jgi:hypothetical protein
MTARLRLRIHFFHAIVRTKKATLPTGRTTPRSTRLHALQLTGWNGRRRRALHEVTEPRSACSKSSFNCRRVVVTGRASGIWLRSDIYASEGWGVLVRLSLSLKTVYFYHHYGFAFCLLISHDLLILPASQLICYLASGPLPPSSAFSVVLPYIDASPPDQADDGDGNEDSQATLARFAFTSSMRKHFRSGESIVHHPIIILPSAVRGHARSSAAQIGCW